MYWGLGSHAVPARVLEPCLDRGQMRSLVEEVPCGSPRKSLLCSLCLTSQGPRDSLCGQSAPEAGGLYKSDWQSYHRIESSHGIAEGGPRGRTEGTGPIYPSPVLSMAKALFWKADTQL